MAEPDINSKEYKTAFERIYGQQGVVVDKLGRKLKEKQVEAPRNPRHVLAFRDHTLDFPELYLNVYVTGPSVDAKGFAHMFARAQCWQADCIEDADLVVFTGGPDVDPAYYGEKPHHSYYGDSARDDYDIQNFLQCYWEGVPMFGVCRGAQFLAVMAGGCKLYQDIDEHHGDHPMWDIREKEMLPKISSVHHQAVMPSNEIQLLGVSHNSRTRVRSPDAPAMGGTGTDVEAFFIREACCLGVQGHPEYKNYNRYTQWCLKQINDFVVTNPDVAWSDTTKQGRLRMKPDLLALRPAGRLETSTTKPNLMLIGQEA